MRNNGIHVHQLANQLLVLTQEVHAAPVATCWVWYRVGSRNEINGHTGISHWVEHMLFNGTPDFPKGTLDRIVARNGGVFNGFTSHDFTAYFETLPADRIELGLQIESDRMINALFLEQDVESERTVILAELEGKANYPETWLDEAVKSAAFTLHPYRQPVIGYKNDLLAMNRDDLYHHYQTYYMPNNAVLVLVGDFDTSALMERVEHYFGGLPTGPTIPRVYAVEPEPQGERRVTINRPGPVPYLQIGYLVPDCRSTDFVPLFVLDAVLSGAKSLAMFGGGAQTNRSARIYKALVETQLASSASSSFWPTIDQFLFELEATVHPDRDIAEVEAALTNEIETIQRDGISAEELARVTKQMRAQVAYGAESVTNQALLLGLWEMIDTYQRSGQVLDQLATVQAADVQRVAQTYLTRQRRTVGHFLPTNTGSISTVA
ncbi:MAG: insulinase family protein [Chloroflexaceae bacterium]|nr:insulinase family protein [Chloroflexaceae bacterium]